MKITALSGAFVWARRNHLGLSQEDWPSMLGFEVSQSLIRNARQLAKALKLPLAELLRETQTDSGSALRMRNTRSGARRKGRQEFGSATSALLSCRPGQRSDYIDTDRSGRR